MSKKPLRVGFDLDGVLLYNPARIVRPLIVFAKKFIVHQKKTKFFIPHTAFEQWIWKILHYSSLFIAPGLNEIKTLVDEGKIEAFIITGRYGFLKDDFEKWMNKVNKNAVFKKAYLNTRNEQPHVFKKRTIRSLNLDIFIEDNWDIVKQLNVGIKKPKVLWIYNIFDRKLQYGLKFPTLKKALDYIESLVATNPS